MSVPDSEDWNFGSGDFSVDYWVRFTTLSGAKQLLGQNAAASRGWGMYKPDGGTGINFTYLAGSYNDVNFPYSFSVNVWYHIAAVRSGSNLTIYVNGIQSGNTHNIGASVINNSSSASFYIGENIDTGYSLNGYLDELSVIKGRALTPEEIKAAASRRPYAVYTSPVVDAAASVRWDTVNWTEGGVNTGNGEQPYSANSLVAQWDFNDTSGTTLTASSSGSCTTSCNGTLTNFASTGSQDAAAGTGWTANNKKWPASPSQGGGAGALMFDGTNDYVSVPDSDNWNFGSGDLSIDFWVKTNNTSGLGIMGQTNSLGNGNSSFIIRTRESASSVTLVRFSTDGTNWALALGTTVAIDDGKWHYVSITRNGTTVILYIDGVNVASRDIKWRYI